MVHNFAKALIIIFLSVLLAAGLSFIIFLSLSRINDGYLGNSSLGLFALINDFFGWLIYAIPLSIIGFKIYPEPKNRASKK